MAARWEAAAQQVLLLCFSPGSLHSFLLIAPKPITPSVTKEIGDFLFFFKCSLCSLHLFSQQRTVNTTDVAFKSKSFPSSDGRAVNHVCSKARRKQTVYQNPRRAGALLKKLTQDRARDHVTEAKIFGIFMLYFATSNCVTDKRPERDKGEQVRWNKKQDCSIWHADDQLLHNEPLRFWGALYYLIAVQVDEFIHLLSYHFLFYCIFLQL